MQTVLINNKPYQVDGTLDGFDLLQKPSTNVEIFGIDHDCNQLFVQFKNGLSYIFNGVDSDTLDEAKNAESIGKFISSSVVRKFESQKVTRRLVEVKNEG